MSLTPRQGGTLSRIKQQTCGRELARDRVGSSRKIDEMPQIHGCEYIQNLRNAANLRLLTQPVAGKRAPTAGEISRAFQPLPTGPACAVPHARPGRP